MNGVLYRGCTVPVRLPFIESAARFILDRLDIALDDMEGETCCMDPVGLRSVSTDGWLGIAGRIHSVADGREIVTLCDGCTLSLSDAAGRTAGTVSDVTGFLELMHRNIGAVRDCTVSGMGLRMAVFPGCHCESACHRKGLDASSLMSDLLGAAGCTPLLPDADLCCGGGVSMIDDALSGSILDESVDSFRRTGADAVCTSCPFCFMRFDTVARYRTYHIAEVVAASMGWGTDTSVYHRGR